MTWYTNTEYQYIRYGQVGWTPKTKLGKFILTCTGYYKDDV